MSVADGRNSVPLGIVFDLPIQFGDFIIPINAMVVDTTTYDLLIGNDWLKKAKAVIDMNACKMRITWKQRKYEVPLDLERGIRPQMVNDESDIESEDETGEYNLVQVKTSTIKDHKQLTEKDEGYWRGYKYGEDDNHNLCDQWTP